MWCLIIVTAAFIFCGKFENFECSENIQRDRRLKEEVDDFADYLKQKLEKHPVSISHSDSVKTSRDENDDDYLDNNRENGKKQIDANIESLLEDLSRNNPEGSDSLRNTDRHSSKREKMSVNRRKSKSDASAKQHHGVEEIVYIRKSDSDLNDPIPEMIEKLVNDQPAGRSTRYVQGHSPDAIEAEFPMSDDPNANSPFSSACPVENIVSDLDQTCSDGPEYEMEFHPMLSEALRRQMLAMLPEPDPKDSKCDITKPLGPETGVEDRALCPFVMDLNNNTSRLPEFLYEAKCSCSIPNLPNMKGKGIGCILVKRAIPVLWLVSCKDGKKRYRQGWDEIAVACASMEEHSGDAIDPPYQPA